MFVRKLFLVGETIVGLFGRKAHITLYQMFYINYIVLFVHPVSWCHLQSNVRKCRRRLLVKVWFRILYRYLAWDLATAWGRPSDGLAGAGSFYSFLLHIENAHRIEREPSAVRCRLMKTQSRYKLNPATNETCRLRNLGSLY